LKGQQAYTNKAKDNLKKNYCFFLSIVVAEKQLLLKTFEKIKENVPSTHKLKIIF